MQLSRSRASARSPRSRAPEQLALDADQQRAALPQERRAGEPRVGLVEPPPGARNSTSRCGRPVRSSSAAPPSISSARGLASPTRSSCRGPSSSIVPRSDAYEHALAHADARRDRARLVQERHVHARLQLLLEDPVGRAERTSAGRCAGARSLARLLQRDPRAELQARARRRPAAGSLRDDARSSRCAARTSRARGRAGRRETASAVAGTSRSSARASTRDAAPAAPPPMRLRDAAASTPRRERGRLREAVGEGAEVALERHASTSRAPRRRSSARAVRDLTVPSGMPSTAAVSCSPRSSTKRQASTLRSRSGSVASASRRRPSPVAGGLGGRRLPRELAPRRARPGPRAAGGCARGCAPRWRRSRAARGETRRRGGSAAAPARRARTPPVRPPRHRPPSP